MSGIMAAMVAAVKRRGGVQKKSAPPAHAALEPTGAQTSNYVDGPARSGGSVVAAAARRAAKHTGADLGGQSDNYVDKKPRSNARKAASGVVSGFWR